MDVFKALFKRRTFAQQRRFQRPGLALGGGAARGWAHLGVINYFEEHNIRPAAIAGTSIGALVGGFYAAGRLDKLKEIATTYTKRDYLRLFDPRLMHAGLFQGERITRFLREHIGDIRIENLPVPYAAVSTSLCTGEEIDITQGSMADAVRASISVPAFFQPVKRGGHLLADGGLSNPVPVDVAADMCNGPVIASQLVGRFDAGAEELKEKHKLNILEVTLRSICIMQRQLSLAHYRTHPPDLLISSALSDVRLREFHKSAYCVEKGYSAAAAAMGTVMPKRAARRHAASALIDSA